VLDELKRIQQRDKLSDAEMGRRLGVGRSRWNAIRNGKQTLSDNLALAAAGVWPELTRDLIDRAASAASSQTQTARTEA
jgi:transcriptional regulator with XRE-family HTH domain